MNASSPRGNDKPVRKPNWEIFIFSIPFACFSLYMSYGFYLSYQEQQHASADFMPVTATILSSQVHTTMHSNPGSSSTRVHRPRIVYQYQVDGRTYQSRQFSYFSSGQDKETVQAIVDRYPPGSTHHAYYNPAHPSEAVLNRAMPSAWWKHFWFPAIFLAVSALSLFAGWKGWPGKTQG